MITKEEITQSQKEEARRIYGNMRNAIKKSVNSQYSSSIAKDCALVSARSTLATMSTDWGCGFWKGVVKEINLIVLK